MMTEFFPGSRFERLRLRLAFGDRMSTAEEEPRRPVDKKGMATSGFPRVFAVRLL